MKKNIDKIFDAKKYSKKELEKLKELLKGLELNEINLNSEDVDNYINKNKKVSWHDAYILATNYFNFYGNLNINCDFRTNDGISKVENGFRLGNWIIRQRSLYNKNQISMEHKQLLDKINMEWFNVKEKNNINYSSNIDIFLNETKNIEVLSKEKEYDLFKRYNEGEKELFDEILIHNIKLVVTIAFNYKNYSSIDIEDLIQEGLFGLMEAINKFDYTLGNKFSTYAYYLINRDILNYLSKNINLIEIPNKKYLLSRQINKEILNYYNENNSYPSYKYLSQKFNIDINTIKELLYLNSIITSIEDISDNELSDRGECIDNIDDKLLTDTIKKEIDSALDKMTQKQKEIIIYRYGFNNERAHTLEEVSKKFNISKEYTRQIEKKVLFLLRRKQLLYELYDMKYQQLYDNPFKCESGLSKSKRYVLNILNKNDFNYNTINIICLYLRIKSYYNNYITNIEDISRIFDLEDEQTMYILDNNLNILLDIIKNKLEKDNSEILLESYSLVKNKINSLKEMKLHLFYKNKKYNYKN